MYVSLTIFFPGLTADLQTASYKDCYNKLTFRRAYTLPVDVFDVVDELN